MEPSLMSLSGGEVAAKCASSASGEDRISALPDELLLDILLLLRDAADAARTSVLSRRWRSVWTLLPDLRVPFFPEPLSFRRALIVSQLRRLRYLRLEGDGDGATLESLATWLPAAARRLSFSVSGTGGTLVLVNSAPDPEGMPTTTSSRILLVKQKKERFFEMPCLENAGKVFLDLGFVRALMPFSGVFAQLAVLILERVWFQGLCVLGDAAAAAASSPRWCCPCLQVLKIRNARGLSDLVVSSESLLELELKFLDSLWELTVEAAVLKKLTVVNCFVRSRDRERDQLIVATAISAPQLEFLDWSDLPGQRSVKLGRMPYLQSIGELKYVVYGIQLPNGGTENNAACMDLLQPFKAIEYLALSLVYVRELDNYQYMMEDMKVLPNPAILYLSVLANGHSLGASLFHVLRMCLGIKKLVLVLLDNVKAEEKTPCLPVCICHEQPNWKTEELLLINLQEIEIRWLRGSEHEVSFVKRLLNWTTALNKMTVTLSSSTTESNAKELFQMLKSLCNPRVCIELKYHNHKEVLYTT